MSAKPPRLVLQADTAEDLMSKNPISVREDADVQEAIALITRRGYSAAPVINDGGRAVGVISVTDILIHNRESAGCCDATARCGSKSSMASADEGGVAVASCVTVGDIMTPTVFAIRRDSTAAAVVQTMIAYQIHQVFVTDEDGTLIGVITGGDILRQLK
jgi:CBS domain-containing protein